MLRWVYTLLVYCLLPLAFFKLLWQGRKNKAYRQHWGERLGFVSDLVQKPSIWIHAVSVGETIAIRPLVEALLKKYPTHKIWLTNGTINGRTRAEALFGDRVLHSYAPYDTPLGIRRFLKSVNPILVLIMETEVWINWIYALKQKKIPVILVNARLSERSYQGYQRFNLFFKSAWQSFTAIAAQTAQDAKRYELLGIKSTRIQVIGNLKYNLLLPANLDEEIRAWKQCILSPQIWIAASTHVGEEEQLLSVFLELKKHYPKLLWILVPRHPERVEVVKKLCEKENWLVKLRSQCEQRPSQKILDDILIIDTIGELLLFYAISQVAFVGGSLIEKGGHNILEPAAVGTVITCGPWMFNFAVIVEQFKAAGALMQCQNLEDLKHQTLVLFENEHARHTLRTMAKICFERDQESLQKHLALIETVM